ncbi:NrdH-redoxin [Corynebacterium incognita]|uniref:NrdH-redoxin n=1 Tax=Corynebacterium incognita TaxID=2754725 RepID=A0A7G7CNK9_9CORY|nr:glutaredoxin domain-containing protein [Corynebacterium incognita]QNE89175.1 NrdH-redoxin [Corynebacterium incognita]
MTDATNNAQPTAPQTTDHVTIFYATWCPYCANLRKRLDRTETPYTLIDVDDAANPDNPAEFDEDAIAAANEWIESVNDGNRIVPTVLYSDGTHATNPEASAVRAKLRELTGEE